MEYTLAWKVYSVTQLCEPCRKLKKFETIWDRNGQIWSDIMWFDKGNNKATGNICQNSIALKITTTMRKINDDYNIFPSDFTLQCRWWGSSLNLFVPLFVCLYFVILFVCIVFCLFFIIFSPLFSLCCGKAGGAVGAVGV